MALDKITYQDKSNLNPVNDRPQQATAEDFNEIKSVVNNLIDDYESGDVSQKTFLVSLPSAGSVSARIAGAAEGTDYPTGWVLTAGASSVDLNVQHSLGKRVVSVSIFAVTGDEEQLLIGSASNSGIITPDIDNLLIKSLATIPKRIQVYITFI